VHEQAYLREDKSLVQQSRKLADQKVGIPRKLSTAVAPAAAAVRDERAHRRRLLVAAAEADAALAAAHAPRAAHGHSRAVFGHDRWAAIDWQHCEAMNGLEMRIAGRLALHRSVRGGHRCSGAKRVEQRVISRHLESEQLLRAQLQPQCKHGRGALISDRLDQPRLGRRFGALACCRLAWPLARGAGAAFRGRLSRLRARRRARLCRLLLPPPLAL